MATSWDATGRLAAHWRKVGGRDKLAVKTGINAGNLSGYNTGRRPLGVRTARRIAAALDVTIYDLGAPSRQAEILEDLLVLDRLQALEAADEERQAETRDLALLVAALTERVERLEARGSEGLGTG